MAGKPQKFVVMNLGLCGGHRTGKTTLAAAIATAYNMPFVQTNTSAVFREHGLDPAVAMDFATRLEMQQHILHAAIKIWQQEPDSFVSDRTPLDMMAYTLADIQGSTNVEFSALDAYLNLCFAVTNRFFSKLAIVQPGIPLIYATGKAALNQAYIEHLNILVVGLCGDRRLESEVLCLERETTDLATRIAKIRDFFPLPVAQFPIQPAV